MSQIIYILFVCLELLLSSPIGMILFIMGVIPVLFIALVLLALCILAPVILAAVIISCIALASILNYPQLLCNVHHFQFFELECPFILHSHVFTFNNASKIVYQVD